MDTETLQAIASVAESLSTLALALSFIAYLMRQVARRDDLLFDDWKRQRDKEISSKDE